MALLERHPGTRYYRKILFIACSDETQMVLLECHPGTRKRGKIILALGREFIVLAQGIEFLHRCLATNLLDKRHMSRDDDQWRRCSNGGSYRI